MRQETWLSLVGWGMGCVAFVLAGCGTAPSSAEVDGHTRTAEKAASLRKPPSLASTIYDLDCDVDADCALVPQGDVCLCAGWGAMRADNEEKFLHRRGRLGARCPDGVAAVCTPDRALNQARCQNRQCIADAPRALSCVDHALGGDFPQAIVLGQTPVKNQDPALSACPGGEAAPEGESEVFLLHPKAAGKYRIALSDQSATGRAVGLIVRTPDCRSDNVACRICTQTSERCLVDEVLGPDDTAVVVVRGCDDACTLQVGQWDPATPLVPPL